MRLLLDDKGGIFSEICGIPEFVQDAYTVPVDFDLEEAKETIADDIMDGGVDLGIVGEGTSF